MMTLRIQFAADSSSYKNYMPSLLEKQKKRSYRKLDYLVKEGCENKADFEPRTKLHWLFVVHSL